MWLQYAEPFAKGTWVTLIVSIDALVLGMILALIFTLAESARWKVVQWPAVVITTILRGLPELLVLFAIYFGSTIALTALMGHYVDVNAFVSGVLALALIFAAYAAQTLRGAYQAIPKGQTESALALGLSKSTLLWRIILPQMWRFALPGLSNLWLVLLKDSALVSLIGLSDLMNVAHVASANTGLPFNFYVAAGAIYLVLTSFSQWGVRRLQQRQTRGEGYQWNG